MEGETEASSQNSKETETIPDKHRKKSAGRQRYKMGKT